MCNFLYNIFIAQYCVFCIYYIFYFYFPLFIILKWLNIAIVRSHLSNLKYGTKLSSRIFTIDMAMLKIKFGQKSFHVISQINLTLGCKVKLAIDKSYWRMYCIKVLCLVQICSSCKNLKFSCSDILIHNCKNTHMLTIAAVNLTFSSLRPWSYIEFACSFFNTHCLKV